MARNGIRLHEYTYSARVSYARLVLGLVVALQPFKVAILRILTLTEERAISEVKLPSTRDVILYRILLIT